jgi:ubiquinone/menaquinone biosynthesis C-methylase UbiE
MQLDTLYTTRFDAADEAWKRQVWEVLWRRVFSRWIGPDDVLLDVGGGYCELSNAAVARRRIVVDMNPETLRHAGPGVEVHVGPADSLPFLTDGSVDVAFSSNFFEHLPDKAALTRTVGEIRRVLRPGGRLIVVGPNLRLMTGAYWDYYDHHLPLTERSVTELLGMLGFEVERSEARFLPSTVKSRLPRWPWLVDAYLLLRPFSSLAFGKQFLVLARKPDPSRTPAGPPR